MSDHTPETPDTSPEALPHSEINHSRRRLAGAALGVSAIFTLASRPVLATDQCMSTSGAVSVNLSQHCTPTGGGGGAPGGGGARAGAGRAPGRPGGGGAGGGGGGGQGG